MVLIRKSAFGLIAWYKLCVREEKKEEVLLMKSYVPLGGNLL